MKKEKRTIHLQWKYFISYALVMLVVMSLLLAYVYQSFYAFHSNSLLNNYRSSLQVIRSQYENLLSDMISISGQLVSTDGIIPFNYLEEPERMKQYPRRLSAYRATHDEVEELYLWFYDDPFIYSADGGNLLKTLIDSGLVIEDVSGDELAAMLNDVKRMEIWPEKTMKGFVVSFTRPEQRILSVFVPVKLASGNRVGTLLYLINHTTLEKWFNEAMPNSSGAYILSDETVLVSHAPKGIPAEVVLEALRQIPEGSDMTAFIWEGKGYRLLAAEGELFSYRHLAVIADSELAVILSSSVQMLLIVSVIVAALGMLVSIRVVQSRMKPIHLIHGMLTDTKPSGNELVEIRDNIQRLIDQNQRLAGQVEDMRILKKSDFVRRFLTGSYADQDDYLAMAEAATLNVEHPLFLVGLVAFPSDCGYEISAEKFDQHFDDSVSGAVRILTGEQKAVLLAYAQTEAQLMDFARRRLEGIRVQCPGVTMAVSKAHVDYREGPRAYLEADSAFEMRFVRGNTDIIVFEPAAQPSMDPATTQKLADRLRQALRSQDPAEVSATLGTITQTVHTMELSLFDFRCMYNDIFSAISGVATQLKQGEKVHDLFRLGECLSLDDLDRMLRKVCNDLLADSMVQAQERDIPENIRMAKDWISNSFTDPGLSVAAIAEKAGLTDSKLSVAFKNAYHQTPLEMITRKRMLLAKELLLATTLPVKDIAIECGYYDISSFNRRFKAHTGMAPLQYRQEGAAREAQDENE